MLHLKLLFNFFTIFLLNGVINIQCSEYTHKHRNPVIIGGVEADISEVPFQVALYLYGGFQCGGSILNEWYIIIMSSILRVE